MFTSVDGNAALLKLALDWAKVGDDEPVPLEERRVMAEMERQTHLELVAQWARFVAELEERAAPLAAVLFVAADADPEAAAVHAQSDRNRLRGAEIRARGRYLGPAELSPTAGVPRWLQVSW